MHTVSLIYLLRLETGLVICVENIKTPPGDECSLEYSI